MFNSSLWIAAIVGVLVSIFVLRAALRLRLRWRERRWLPAELHNARLLFAEQLFVARKVALVARVDRVYEGGGELVLVELKTRGQHRVYESDVIELSAQKLAVEADRRRRVSDIGYVLTQRGSSKDRQVHTLKLLSSSHVEQLVARRKDLVEKRVEPRYASNARLCEACPYKRQCVAGLLSHATGHR